MTDTPKRKAGRPPKSGVAMPTSQRTREYRARRKVASQSTYEAASVAHENLKSATTDVLLAGLARQIKSIETNLDHAPVSRDIAAMIIHEICDRHEIKLMSS